GGRVSCRVTYQGVARLGRRLALPERPAVERRWPSWRGVVGPLRDVARRRKAGLQIAKLSVRPDVPVLSSPLSGISRTLGAPAAQAPAASPSCPSGRVEHPRPEEHEPSTR